MKQGYFITGTDTGVGKTLFSCALLRQLARDGVSAIGMKPVAAGCATIDGKLINDDVEALRTSASVRLTAEQICPYLLPAAVAPHIAAEEVGTRIQLAVISNHFRQLSRQADALVVEGVGGFIVPLDDRHDTADLAAIFGLPVILVVAMRLGCLNHALLTARAIRDHGLHLAGWVANRIAPDMPRCQQNIAALTLRLGAPPMADVAYQTQPDPAAIHLRLDPP